MARLIIEHPDADGPVPLAAHDVYLGRSAEGLEVEGNFIGLPDEEVSRRHARIVRQNDRYLLQDLNSTNGTRLDGVPVTPGGLYPLRDGSRITLGRSTVRVQLDDSDTGTRKFRPGLGSGDSDDPAAGMVEEEGALAPATASVILDAPRLVAELRDATPRAGQERDELLRRLTVMTQVSISLGATRDEDELWHRIADCVFEIFPRAERINLLLYQGRDLRLRPVLARWREAGDERGGAAAISRGIVRDVIKKRQSLLLLDAQGEERFAARDSVVNLALRSVMCVPLLYEDEVLGLVQVDSTRGAGEFSAEDLQVLTGIAAQMAIAVRNLQLHSEIETLFEGFVTASVQVIEARDPVTAGHSFRVAEFTQNLAAAVDRADGGRFRQVRFDRDRMREIRYAALLHDFGKVGVRENVLTKARKLHDHDMALLKQRFRYAMACLEREAWRELVLAHEQRPLTAREFRRRRREVEQRLAQERERLQRFLDRVLAANEPAVMPDAIEGLEEVAAFMFRDGEDNHVPLLTPFEFSTLSLTKGSLNPEERAEIESHVTHTYAFLNLIPWTGNLSRVPEIAFAHHEKLDGSGYPRRLTGDQIPLPSKIMTIADIYDALTSGDRPYKQGLPVEQALDILQAEARAGKLDAELLALFIDSRSYVMTGAAH